MSGNTFGVLFRVTTFGESHGKAIGAVIDGCPPRLALGEADIQAELNRRKPGGHKASTSRKEEDRVEILSGVFEGETTGTPIALLIRNSDADSEAYDDLRDVFRPGHGDFTYLKKYGIRDPLGGGRASGRETAARVAAGAVARKLLTREGLHVLGCTVELGGIGIETWSRDAIGANRLLCPDPEAATRMEQKLEEVRGEGDSLGGIVEIRVTGCPAGLGEPVFDKIDAELAGALMSIGTVKGVEIGAGFEAARMKGSQCNDPIGPERVQDQSRGRSACGDHDGAGNRDPGGLQAHRLHRPGAGNHRRPGKPAKDHGPGQARRLRHPPHRSRLRGHGLPGDCGSSAAPESLQINSIP